MSVLDRVHRAQRSTDTTEDGDQTSQDQSSTQADSLSRVAQRIKIVAEELIHYVDSKGGDSPFAGHMWFIKSIFEVFFDEMKGQDDEKLSLWLGQFGVLLTWCASGDDSVLPQEVVDYLKRFHPTQLSITAGANADAV